MIEMLGVLAIIGVLSVGGIAGYSKAMMKYRINKTVDQITQMVTRTRVAFVAQKNYRGLGSTEAEVNAVLVTANIIPQEYLVRDARDEIVVPYVFRNPFRGHISVRYGDKLQPGDKAAFVIRYDFIPKPACIEMATSPWGGPIGSGYLGLAINTPLPPEITQGNCVPTDIHQVGYAVHCPHTGIMLKEAAAHACVDQKDNVLEFKFY